MDESPAARPARTVEEWRAIHERIERTVDPHSLAKGLSMLRTERFRLFAEVAPDHVVGIVGSQSSKTRVYSCRLASDGSYGCGTQNLITCVLSHGSPCKHLLVLVLGLMNAGKLDPERAIAWLEASRALGSKANQPKKDLLAETFFRYKAVQAGEIDWRPTETIPEDFYAM